MELIRNLDHLPRGSRVYIYGTGSAGRSLFMWLKKCREDIVVLGFIDSFKSGRCAGKKVFQVERFVEGFERNACDRVLIASGANRAMARRLDELGIKNYSIVSVPSYLMGNLLPESLSQKLTAAKIKLLSPFFRRRIHLFFGEHGGKFIGNNKYYYLYLKGRIDAPVYWVVDDTAIFDELKEEGIDVLDCNERTFTRYLFRAAYFYFDNMTWQRKYPYLRYFKARIVHMSHGVGLKMTEKMLIPPGFMEALTPGEKKRLDSKLFENHLLVSTSGFYAEKVSAPAYNTPLERITRSGYPRNDIFYRDIPGSEIFTDKETLGKVKAFKGKGIKVVVYAPTFRDMDSRFKYADFVDDSTFDRYLRDHGMVLVVKGHTNTGGGNRKKGTGTGNSGNILFYRSDRDGYPLLKEADLLITDYSSIYMDFLHLRKPVVFFVYDYDEYIAGHREFQFDYEEMTPGPKARNYDELTGWLTRFLIENNDRFQKERDALLTLAFEYKDGNASERLSREMVK